MIKSVSTHPVTDAYFRLASFRGIPNPLPLDAHSLSYQGVTDSRWGDFHAPNPLILPARHEFVQDAVKLGALRVCVFGSFYRGLDLVNDLLQLEHHPGKVAVLTGLCTDGVSDAEAKVSAHKRVWQYIAPEDREAFVAQVMNLALRQGIPVYTGEVKSDIFHGDIYPHLFMPDIALMTTFGQRIDGQIFSLPRFGMYNLHPSDLARGRFPGPNPFREMIGAGERTTRMTIHSVDENFDSGRVVGFSPEISIGFCEPERWTIEERTIALHKKTSLVAGLMARRLLFAVKEKGTPVFKLDFEEFLRDECLTTESMEMLQSPIPGGPRDHFSHRVLAAS